MVEQDWTEEDQAADNARWAHVRSENRESMFLLARLRRLGSSWLDIKVRNLSPGGMMAEVPASFVRGEPVEVELRGLGEVPGKVAWTSGWRIGVAFDHRVNHRLCRKPVASASAAPMLVKAALCGKRPGLR